MRDMSTGNARSFFPCRGRHMHCFWLAPLYPRIKRRQEYVLVQMVRAVVCT